MKIYVHVAANIYMQLDFQHVKHVEYDNELNVLVVAVCEPRGDLADVARVDLYDATSGVLVKKVELAEPFDEVLHPYSPFCIKYM